MTVPPGSRTTSVVASKRGSSSPLARHFSGVEPTGPARTPCGVPLFPVPPGDAGVPGRTVTRTGGRGGRRAPSLRLAASGGCHRPASAPGEGGSHFAPPEGPTLPHQVPGSVGDHPVCATKLQGGTLLPSSGRAAVAGLHPETNGKISDLCDGCGRDLGVSPHACRASLLSMTCANNVTRPNPAPTEWCKWGKVG